MDEVLDDMSEMARTGIPDLGWTCGKCGLDGKQGVKVYYHKRVLGTRRGKEIIDFGITLVCPNCTFQSARKADSIEV
jgi:hypothetical protein